MALDNDSISAQKRQLSAHARTERIAVQQLKMKTADATVTIYLGGQR
jgi:cell division protein FtsL